MRIPAGWDSYEFMVSEALIRRLALFPGPFLAEASRPERAFLPLVEPVTGRFLSQDQWPGSAWRPRSANQFVYVANNPVNAIERICS